MSIFKGTLKEFDRVAKTGSFIFNTNRIGELVADGSDSVMKYTINFLNPRNPAHEYKLDETKAAIDALHGGDDAVISLPVLKKRIDGVTMNYVKEVSFGVGKIAYGYANPENAAQTWIECYPNGFKKVEYLVNETIDQVVVVA
jgi:hypothetical protein